MALPEPMPLRSGVPNNDTFNLLDSGPSSTNYPTISRGKRNSGLSLSPYVKCVCPSCFEEIYLGDCRIVSGRTPGKVLKERPTTWWARQIARINLERLDGLELAHRECPECHYLLPYNIERVPSITLAVVGNIFAGKSHYITALIHQIKEDWISNAEEYAQFTCLTPEVEKGYTEEYFEPLFVNRQVLLPTKPAAKSTANPLIYELVVSPSSKRPPTAVNLMIYDTAGEDFEHVDRLVQFARYVFNTSALIFVVDPLTMTDVVLQLPPSLHTILNPWVNLAQGRRAADILNSTLSILERFHGYPDGASFPDVPVAVMISKADLFKFLNLPDSYTFMMQPQYGRGIDLRDIDTVDREVRGLLRIYKQGDLLAATNRLRRVKFFASSATGEPPDATNHFRIVKPYRCLDPVLWILYQLGIVKAIE